MSTSGGVAGRVVGLNAGLVKSGRVQLLDDAAAEISVIPYTWDAERRLIVLGNVSTDRKADRGNGYATRLIQALAAAAPSDFVLRAEGLHSEEGLGWMAKVGREHGLHIHQDHRCFEHGEYCTGSDLPHQCPVKSTQRGVWFTPESVPPGGDGEKGGA
jgi:hypothetical protein